MLEKFVAETSIPELFQLLRVKMQNLRINLHLKSPKIPKITRGMPKWKSARLDPIAGSKSPESGPSSRSSKTFADPLVLPISPTIVGNSARHCHHIKLG